MNLNRIEISRVLHFLCDLRNCKIIYLYPKIIVEIKNGIVANNFRRIFYIILQYCSVSLVIGVILLNRYRESAYFFPRGTKLNIQRKKASS